jgi:signal transduction histidine kinase
MSTGSLRVRLLVLSALTISLALMIAGIMFYYRFQQHVENLMLQEFDAHFEQLAGSVTFDDAGQLQMDGDLSDPRFAKQYGGLYWQISASGTETLRSRSLWDEVLTIPTPPASAEEEHVHTLVGPNNSSILALERVIQIEKPDGTTLKAVVTIGMDRSKVSNTISAFRGDMSIGFALLYLVLLMSSLFLIFFGLKPLQAIRRSLVEIHKGRANRLDGSFPNEVGALVGELNTLLEDREKQVHRARHRAGNLAHGLKTPLTVLDSIALDLDQAGKTEPANEIRQATRDMHQFVERELMRSRVAANQSLASTLLAPVVERVASAINKISGGRIKPVEIEVDKDISVPMDEGDLHELLGNLMENAAKFATTRIVLKYSGECLSVSDDGPGVPGAELDNIAKRGVKLDQHKRGSGLGLAIVQDLADAYGGTLSFSRSGLGGLKVEFRFNGGR